MMVPPVGAVGAALSSSSLAGLAGGASSALGGVESANLPPGALEGTKGMEGTGGLEGVGGSAGVGGVPGSAGVGGAPGTEGGEGVMAAPGAETASGTAGGGFGEALTHAISSLEATQQSSDGAAQALATGTATNPESAVVTVEDAQLAMQLASQVRTKAVEAAQQIFQTQV